MEVIEARNVCEALPKGVSYLLQAGAFQDSRAGRVIVAPGPVTTVYERPCERVLFSAVRDATPFFHLMESLWLLAGRDDTGFLDHYVKDFGTRFAEYPGDEQAYLHGSYGARWRTSLGFDQLKFIIQKLKSDPASRQCVLQMWDASDQHSNDLQGDFRDRPCNTQVYFRMRRGELDMTVTCRSNDIIMGAYGANAVQFSILQEYMAGMIGVPIGKYWQVSNDFHAYVRDLDRLTKRTHMTNAPIEGMTTTHMAIRGGLLGLALRDDRYTLSSPSVWNLVLDPLTFDEELNKLMHLIDWIHVDGVSNNRSLKKEFSASMDWRNTFLSNTALQMAIIHWWFKNPIPGIDLLDSALTIGATDWNVATTEWLNRRTKPSA